MQQRKVTCEVTHVGATETVKTTPKEQVLQLSFLSECRVARNPRALLQKRRKHKSWNVSTSRQFEWKASHVHKQIRVFLIFLVARVFSSRVCGKKRESEIKNVLLFNIITCRCFLFVSSTQVSGQQKRGRSSLTKKNNGNNSVVDSPCLKRVNTVFNLRV